MFSQPITIIMGDSGTIVLLINPLAKKNKTQQIVAAINEILSKKKIPFASFTEHWPEEINTFKEVWLIGGDGALNYLLNFYKNISIPIVIFKGGTGNDFASKLYCPISINTQIKKVLTAEIKKVDAAECNGRKFINGVGIGFDGEVLKSMSAIRLLGGHLGYLWIVIRKMFSFKERLYQIQFDAENLSEKFLLVMITNSTTTGGGFIVSPEAKIDDGKLNMVLCRPLPILKRLKYLPVIEKGKHLNKDFILHKMVSNVVIECEEETLAQIDGELISAKTFDIKVLPGQYLFKY
ncbi:MAG TPA: diacylglycerol kinase family protein [Chitinophagaceae bacterium]|nr:diacylglycerol kinase family protein [Chitinophagaceae bacterium]